MTGLRRTHSGIGIIALVPEPWQFIARTTRHHVLQRLGTHFEVIWVEPSIYWREYLARPSFLVRPTGTFEPVSGLQALPADPIHARWYRPDALARLLERGRLRQAKRMLVARGCTKFVLYIWRPEFAAAAELLCADLVCYHIDDEYTFSRDDEPVGPAEGALIRRADIVFVHSKALFQKKGHLNPHTHIVPNGVDFQSFSAHSKIPPELQNIPAPRIGYVGVIKQQLDLGLMLEIARARPDWSLVFVGPIGSIGDQRGALEALRGLSNCHFVERQPVERLPAFVQHLDVCALCYVRDGYTKYIYPLKLHEYLAAGRPVVATPIPALDEFRDVALIGESAQEWVAAIEKSLAADARSDVAVQRRQAIARRFDWDGIVAAIAFTIEKSLDTESKNAS